MALAMEHDSKLRKLQKRVDQNYTMGNLTWTIYDLVDFLIQGTYVQDGLATKPCKPAV